MRLKLAIITTLKEKISLKFVWKYLSLKSIIIQKSVNRIARRYN